MKHPKPDPSTPEELAAMIAGFAAAGTSRREAARIAQVEEKTIRRWETGESRPHRAILAACLTAWRNAGLLPPPGK